MSLSKTALNILIAGAFAVSLAGTNHNALAAGSSNEKCYGIAKAGQNDCSAKTHSCAGKSTVSGSGADFVALPKGVCAKIVGGSKTPTSPMDTESR